MIKDYQHKNVLAEMKRQVNAAAKISDREARITFVLVHMISEHHELAESAGKPDGENNLFRFVTWCLSRFAEELETPSTEDFKNPIELFKKEQDINLLNLARFRTPAKNAVEKDLDESMEWPKDVPYEEWEEDMLQTAYATLFGLYFFDTPARDLMRWLGKDEPKNYRLGSYQRYENPHALKPVRGRESPQFKTYFSGVREVAESKNSQQNSCFINSWKAKTSSRGMPVNCMDYYSALSDWRNCSG